MCSTSLCCAWQSYFLPFHSTLTQKKPPQLLKSISYFPEEEGDACGKLHILCCIDMKYNMSHFCLFLTSMIHFTSLDSSGLVLLCVITSMCKLLLPLLSFAYWCVTQCSPCPRHRHRDNFKVTTVYLSTCVIERTKRKRIKSLSMANLLPALKICHKPQASTVLQPHLPGKTVSPLGTSGSCIQVRCALAAISDQEQPKWSSRIVRPISQDWFAASTSY